MLKRELNNYDKQVIHDIEKQFEAVYDAKGVLLKPATNIAKVLYGTLSVTAEDYLKTEKGYDVINITPLATITKK